MFRKGDRVWCINYGWGDVVNLDSKDNTIEVNFKEISTWFTADGRYISEPYRILFFEEIPIPKSALERPRKTAEEMLDECEGIEFKVGERNYSIRINRVDNRVSLCLNEHIFTYGIKYISKEDAYRIIRECKENN